MRELEREARRAQLTAAALIQKLSLREVDSTLDKAWKLREEGEDIPLLAQAIEQECLDLVSRSTVHAFFVRKWCVQPWPRPQPAPQSQAWSPRAPTPRPACSQPLTSLLPRFGPLFDQLFHGRVRSRKHSIYRPMPLVSRLILSLSTVLILIPCNLLLLPLITLVPPLERTVVDFLKELPTCNALGLRWEDAYLLEVPPGGRLWARGDPAAFVGFVLSGELAVRPDEPMPHPHSEPTTKGVTPALNSTAKPPPAPSDRTGGAAAAEEGAVAPSGAHAAEHERWQAGDVVGEAVLLGRRMTHTTTIVAAEDQPSFLMVVAPILTITPPSPCSPAST